MRFLELILIVLGLSFVYSQSNPRLDKSQDGKCLVAHNILRALHQNTGPLAWDANLATGAQQWAVYLAKNNRFEHANTKYGENLYSQWGGNSGNDPNSCAKAVHSWYTEEKNYNYNTGRSNGGVIGHFTQQVWKASTKVGVGIAIIGSKVVVVARYDPPGNYQGRYVQNVMKRISGAQTPSQSAFIAQVNSDTTPSPITKAPTTTSPSTRAPETSPPTTSPTTTPTTAAETTPKPDVSTTEAATTKETSAPITQETTTTQELSTTQEPSTTQATSTTQEPGTTSPLTNVAKCCLAAHNILRALHKATGSLEWDDNLAKNARKWADFLAHYGWYSYSRGRYLGKYGENLYKSWSWTSAGDPSDKCAEAVHSWYEEEEDYDYMDGSSYGHGKIHHFTQLVWKSSTKVGFGIAQRRTRAGTRTVVVARYTPRGNVKGKFSQNVMARIPGAQTPTLDELRAKACNKGPVPTPACKDKYPYCDRHRRLCRRSWFRNCCQRTCMSC